MANFTNIYAKNFIPVDSTKGKLRVEEHKESKIHRWIPTDKEEIRLFLGIIALKGFERLSDIKGPISYKLLDKFSDPWDSTGLFGACIPRFISQTRFENFMRFFSDFR